MTRANVIGLSNARKLLEDIPNKIRDAMGIIVGVNLLDKDGKEYIAVSYTHLTLPTILLV